MNPSKVKHGCLVELTDLPNVGKAFAQDLKLLGIHNPNDVAGCDPYEMYERLCEITRTKQDPCVLDTLISITRFVQGEEAKPWWHYTAERKKALAR
jgi:hypothetical protein